MFLHDLITDVRGFSSRMTTDSRESMRNESESFLANGDFSQSSFRAEGIRTWKHSDGEDV